ncbi:hypothetical protein [Microlunatus soli]|uniref:Uncharacterized protein n=1 Tax=Microlunatus soli TaxID=630515 RepID=A0A1H1N982_9ACTN|nr:hypothetical protein [Microlunatus soli]SDR95641.1 hypothetical protein SAMN04489812_0437 [Microlunatus soli]
MSATHAHSSPLSRRGAASTSRAKLQKRHRADLILLAIGVLLLMILVAGIIGLVATAEPTSTGGTVGYTADGAAWVNPPRMAIFWLWVTMMDVAAILGFGVAAAAMHQS